MAPDSTTTMTTDIKVRWPEKRDTCLVVYQIRIAMSAAIDTDVSKGKLDRNKEEMRRTSADNISCESETEKGCNLSNE